MDNVENPDPQGKIAAAAMIDSSEHAQDCMGRILSRSSLPQPSAETLAIFQNWPKAKPCDVDGQFPLGYALARPSLLERIKRHLKSMWGAK